MPETIDAVLIDAYGGPEVMRIGRLPAPVPAPGEILVRVRAAGVNPVDWKTRDGLRRARGDLPMPAVLGCDLAGVVEAVGEGVTAFAPGDEVFAMTGLHGAFARRVALPARHAALKPAILGHVEAAALPLAALTAWQSFALAGLSPGHRVLVHAAAGGVGGYAVQIARALGATEVTGTASAGNLDHVTALGATGAIDYAAQRFEELVAELDVVLDLVGGATQARSWGVLRPGGVLVSAVAVPPEGDPPRGTHRAARVGVRADGAQLAAIAGLIEAGRLQVTVAGTLPYTAAAEALERSKQGHIRGKLVLVFGD
jgi:NADPH:quinone reductase-like Zn-dependent oxidoreductase